MYIKIIIGIKKSKKKNTSIYNVQGMHIKKKGEEPKIQKENSILFDYDVPSTL